MKIFKLFEEARGCEKIARIEKIFELMPEIFGDIAENFGLFQLLLGHQNRSRLSRWDNDVHRTSIKASEPG